MSRSILHCDMNNFYASVECMLDPTLKKYPVAVCGSVEERHGIVLAKNYAAKAFGVATGDAVWQAKQKCKDLVIVPPHYEEYIKYSKLARSVYSRFTDQVEPYGMDECWLDISGTEKLYGSPERVANEIKEIIKFELGLTISVGVSFNKIFAKLGSDMKKPDAITVIEKDTFRDKIWGLPAADLLGVGRATQRVLDSYCIRTIGDLANTNPDFLKRRLGKNGIALWQYANGNDHSLVHNADFVSPIKSVGHGITTVADLEENEQVWPVFLELEENPDIKAIEDTIANIDAEIEALFEDEAMVEEKKVQFIQEHIKKIYVSKNSDVFIVLDNVAGAFLFIDKEDTRIEVVPVAEYNPKELSEEGITENDFVPFDRESMPLHHGRIRHEIFSQTIRHGIRFLHRFCRYKQRRTWKPCPSRHAEETPRGRHPMWQSPCTQDA